MSKKKQRGGKTGLTPKKVSLPVWPSMNQYPAGTMVETKPERFAALAKGRTCGGCQVCCDVVGVETMGKPFFAKCKHQCESGCEVYQDRPGECAGYECLWLKGYFADEDRPDKSHVLVSPEREGLYVYINNYSGEIPNEQIQPTIEKVLADVKGVGCGKNGFRPIVFLEGQHIIVPYECPDYDYKDREEGPYNMEVRRTKQGFEYCLGAGQWRDILYPKTGTNEEGT